MAVFLDTETTGLSPSHGAAIVEVAIVDAAGRALIDTLIDPECSIPYQASEVHGIEDYMVRGKPTLSEVMPRILEVIATEEVVIYNARFDTAFFPGNLKKSRGVACAMQRFADATGGRWAKLDVAAKRVGHKWSGEAHRALADALACRSVWQWLERKSTEGVRRW